MVNSATRTSHSSDAEHLGCFYLTGVYSDRDWDTERLLSAVTANIFTDVRYLCNTFLSKVKPSGSVKTNTTSVSMSKTLDNTVTVRIRKMGQKYITAHQADTLMLFYYHTGSVESRSRGSIRHELVQFMKSGVGRQTSGGHEVWWAWKVQQAQLKHWNIQTFYLNYQQDVERWQFYTWSCQRHQSTVLQIRMLKLAC